MPGIRQEWSKTSVKVSGLRGAEQRTEKRQRTTTLFTVTCSLKNGSVWLPLTIQVPPGDTTRNGT